jgi:hypothetical protein
MEEGVVGIFFKPHGQAQPTVNDIGLMARCVMTPAVFETFREPVTAKEIQICQNNLFELYKSGERPFLWILTSTISKGLLNKLQAVEAVESWEPGVYFLPEMSHAGIIVINALPRTPATLWFRLIGKGVVQEQAIDDFLNLPLDNTHRPVVLDLLRSYKSDLETDSDLDEEEQRLLARLSSIDFGDVGQTGTCH